MNATYDVIVIGTGVAGGTIAAEAQKEGLQTAVIDNRPYGGTCPQRGCDPKKVLMGLSEIYDDQQRVKSFGVEGDLTLNWKKMKEFKDTFTTTVSESVQESFRDLGIASYHGTATFVDPYTIQVNEENITGERIVLATGAKPAPLAVDGAEHIISSDDFFDLEELPEQIAFIGGGYISFEFAHLCARLGKKVSLFHRGKHVLEQYDHEMTDKLVDLTKDLGVDIHTETDVQSVEKDESGTCYLTVKKFDHSHNMKADLVIHGGGRMPNIDDLDLDIAGVEAGKDGITINNNFQSVSQPHIYAAGDVANSSFPPLTPSASLEAKRLLGHLIEGKEHSPLQKTVPSVVFTYPKLAKVGLTQQEASKENIPYEVQSKDISTFFSYKRTNALGAYVKILTSPGTDEILGAHCLTNTADHLINLFTVAVEKKMTKQELSSILWAYPTEESDIPSFF